MGSDQVCTVLSIRDEFVISNLNENGCYVLNKLLNNLNNKIIIEYSTTKALIGYGRRG